MYSEDYRSCPIDRSRLSPLMDRKENNVKWNVYECKTCGSEVWIHPFKRLIQRIRSGKI